MLIPVAFLMSIGPLFAPIAALPLAQQVSLSYPRNNNQLLISISVAMDSLLRFLCRRSNSQWWDESIANTHRLLLLPESDQ